MNRLFTFFLFLPTLGLAALFLGMQQADSPRKSPLPELRLGAASDGTLTVEPGEVVHVRISNTGRYQHRVRIEAPSGDVHWEPELPEPAPE